MFPSQALPKYTNFSGSAEELIAVINQVADALPMGVEPGEVNERLIRHYVAVRVLDRPERMGKVVVYGFRHLLQYLVARRLLRNGFQLAKIAEYTSRVPTAALLKSLDGEPQRSEAQLLIEAYGARSEAQPSGRMDVALKRSTGIHAAKSRPRLSADFIESEPRAAFQMAFGAEPPDLSTSTPESVRSMIDLADRFERTTREQRSQFEQLGERLEQQVNQQLRRLEMRLGLDVARHGLQGSDECREQYTRIRAELHDMYGALRREFDSAIREFSAQQREMSERLMGELVGRLEAVLRHQKELGESLGGLQGDVRAVQRALGQQGVAGNKSGTDRAATTDEESGHED